MPLTLQRQEHHRLQRRSKTASELEEVDHVDDPVAVVVKGGDIFIDPEAVARRVTSRVVDIRDTLTAVVELFQFDPSCR